MPATTRPADVLRAGAARYSDEELRGLVAMRTNSARRHEQDGDGWLADGARRAADVYTDVLAERARTGTSWGLGIGDQPAA